MIFICCPIFNIYNDAVTNKIIQSNGYALNERVHNEEAGIMETVSSIVILTLEYQINQKEHIYCPLPSSNFTQIHRQSTVPEAENRID